MEDDLDLEPLPVVVGGVEIAPQFTDERPAVFVREVQAVVGDAPAVRTMSPWAAGAPVPERTASFLAAFQRMTEVHPDQLAGLAQWWRASARDDTVEIAHRLVLEAPQRDAAGTWRVRGRLRSPWRLRSIPVELMLWPRLGAWTKLAVEPQRDVHVGRRYFRSGHRVLDTLTERLRRELPVPSGASR